MIEDYERILERDRARREWRGQARARWIAGLFVVGGCALLLCSLVAWAVMLFL